MFPDACEDNARTHKHCIPPVAARPHPCFTRAIGVHLDPVALGVVEVNRLADEVIGRVSEREAAHAELGEPGKVAARRQEDGKVIQAGRPCSGALALSANGSPWSSRSQS